jgi:hypothetical protein
MLRQRLRTRRSVLSVVGRLLVVVLAAALAWYGLMLVLLALKVPPGTVNSLSGYRSAYDYLAGLRASDIDGTVRAFAAVGGVLSFLVFGYLAVKQIPRAYLARQDLELSEAERGVVTVDPRAIERLAEVAAREHRFVGSAAGRYGGDDLVVNVSARRAREVADTLQAVQRRVTEALEEHDLPVVRVDVTLAGYEREHRRELN